MARPRKPGKDSPERLAWEAANPLFRWLASNPRENKPVKIARACKCSMQTVYNWLNGHANPDVDKVRQIAKFLKVDPAKFERRWLEWWLAGVEKGFAKETMGAKRVRRMLDLLESEE
jgi:hypothetical protein